jgi:hypothetical protein
MAKRVVTSGLNTPVQQEYIHTQENHPHYPADLVVLLFPANGLPHLGSHRWNQVHHDTGRLDLYGMLSDDYLIGGALDLPHSIPLMQAVWPLP